MASRTAASFTSLKSAASTKSILKRASRPAPLPLSPSPFPFTASFNVKFPASTQSHHVRFLPSPLLYSTLSPASFGLSSSPPSANALEPPASAEPTISPLSPAFASAVGFKLLDPPKPKQKPAVYFKDPRSPRPAPMASLNVAALTLGAQPTTDLRKALMAYPRSPYPSAPLSPHVMYGSSGEDAQGPGVGLKRRNTADNAILTTRHGGDNAGSTSTVTFKLTSSRRLTPPHLDLTASLFQPCINSLSPVGEFETKTNLSVDDAGLSDAFWESVSLENGALTTTTTTTSAAALKGEEEGSDAGFPESVTGSQVSANTAEELFLNTHDHEHALVPQSPPLLFGDSDGALWSPGILQDQPRFAHTSFLRVKRSTFTAPSPKDPLARFPTFGSALQVVAAAAAASSTMDKIRPPPTAHLI